MVIATNSSQGTSVQVNTTATGKIEGLVAK